MLHVLSTFLHFSLQITTWVEFYTCRGDCARNRLQARGLDASLDWGEPLRSRWLGLGQGIGRISFQSEIRLGVSVLESGSCVMTALPLILHVVIISLVIIRPTIFTTRWNLGWIRPSRCRLIFPATKWHTVSLTTALRRLHFCNFICAQRRRRLAAHLRRGLDLFDRRAAAFVRSVLGRHRLVNLTWHLLQIAALGCFLLISRPGRRLVTELCAVLALVVLVTVHADDVAHRIRVLYWNTCNLLTLCRLRELCKAALDKALLALTSLHLLKI